MPDLPRQEPVFGGEMEATVTPGQIPGAGEPIDAPSESIGEYLRQNRLRMGKTLTDISRASKIVTHHLIAIENNAFEELPGRPYAIGFVRSYAACLGLDAGPLVARLKAELAGPDLDPAFSVPNPPARRGHTETESLAFGNADAFSAETRPRLRGWLAGAAQKALHLHKARTVLRIKEFAKIAGELKFDFPSPADRAPPVGNGNGRAPEFDLFSAPERRDQTRIAFADSGNAGRPNVTLFSAPEHKAHLFSTPERRAPMFSPRKRGLPWPSPSGHPVRNWLTAGLMSIAVIYFGSSIVHSGTSAGPPPPVTAVPARLAAEAGFIPEKVAPPAAAVNEQSAPSAPERAPVPAVPPAQDEPHTAATVDEPATLSREAAIDPPGETRTARRDTASAEPKHAFRGQLPLGERYGEQNRGSRVTLRVHRATFVAVLGFRNHQYIDRVLRAGDTYRVPNMRGLKLNTRDAGAVEVILDGNTVGFAGQDGAAVKGMSLQPHSIASQFHWLRD